MPELYEIKGFLANFTLVIGIAAITSFIFYKLRQPVVLGYVLAGMIIGPHIPIPLVADSNIVHTLSELGIILLMFSLGLEFSLRKLVKVLPTGGLIALIECTFMMWLGSTAGQLLGWTLKESIYMGAIIAISSTTIIVKAFSEKGIKGKLSDIVFSILIAEDLIAVLLLAGLPALSQPSGESTWVLAKAASTLVMFLITIIVLGIFVIPRLMRYILKVNHPEMSLVVSVGLCFGMSLLVMKAGYSVALGAFIAGSLMAESGQEGYLHNLIRPLRDMFAAIFFVSVGMLIDPVVILEHWKTVLLFTALVIFGKIIGVTVSSFLAGHGNRFAISSGMSLAQIGEFSFIIAGIGITTGSTRDFIYPIAVAVSAITTLTTPWLILAADPFAKWVDKHLPQRLQTFTTLYGTWVENLKKPRGEGELSRLKKYILLFIVDALIITGIMIGASLSKGVLQQYLMTWFQFSIEVAYIIEKLMAVLFALPFVIGIVRCIAMIGFELTLLVIPVDPTNKLDLARAPRRILTITLQMALVLVIGVPLITMTQTFMPYYVGALFFGFVLLLLGIFFWRSATDFQGHVKAGAQMVLQMLQTTMDKSRHEPLSNIGKQLPGLGHIFSIQLLDHSSAVGKTLIELNFRNLTGANVIAITRGNDGVVVPKAGETLRSGDILAITGPKDCVSVATQILLG